MCAQVSTKLVQNKGFGVCERGLSDKSNVAGNPCVNCMMGTDHLYTYVNGKLSLQMQQINCGHNRLAKDDAHKVAFQDKCDINAVDYNDQDLLEEENVIVVLMKK